MAKTEIKIAVEKVVIHDALKEMIQKISDEYGVMVSNIDIDWTQYVGAEANIVGFEVRTRS